MLTFTLFTNIEGNANSMEMLEVIQKMNFEQNK